MSPDTAPPENGPPLTRPAARRVLWPGRATVALVGIGAVALLVASLALGGRDEPPASDPFAGVGGSQVPPDEAGGLAPPRVRDPDGILPPGALFGIHTQIQERPRTTALIRAATEQLEARLGRRIDITHYFYPWDREFPGGGGSRTADDIEQWDLRHGRIPMISWNGRGAYASDIAAGHHDPLIIDRATRMREMGQPVMIRWFWEMDGNNKAEWAESPADYVAAWRHIVGVFNAQRAHNVSWVWCPNASAFRDGWAQEFYPGPDYVDWLCADGYNWAPGREGARWRSFREIFDAFYDWAWLQDKPLMVGEFGVQERNPGEKAAWLADAQATLKEDFPLIKAVVYFNADHEHDWRIDTSSSAFEAFRRWANDPWFSSDLKRHFFPGISTVD